MTKLYANGCSFVMGQELVDNNPLNLENKRTAFPALIGAYNDAWSGSSNQAIAHRTIEYCKREKPTHAIVGWTHPARVMTFLDDDVRKDRLGQSTIKPSTFPEVFTEYFLNEEGLNRISQYAIEGCYHQLVALGVKPIFFHSFVNYTNVDVPTIFDHLGLKCSCWDYAYDGYKDREQQHPNQEQHDWMANYLMDYIK